MTKLRNLLRCYAMGMGIKSIASAFDVSRNTVRKYLRGREHATLCGVWDTEGTGKCIIFAPKYNL